MSGNLNLKFQPISRLKPPQKINLETSINLFSITKHSLNAFKLKIIRNISKVCGFWYVFHIIIKDPNHIHWIHIFKTNPLTTPHIYLNLDIQHVVDLSFFFLKKWTKNMSYTTTNFDHLWWMKNRCPIIWIQIFFFVWKHLQKHFKNLNNLILNL